MRQGLVLWLTLCVASLVASFMLTQTAAAEVPPEWFGRRVVEVRVVGSQAGRIDPKSFGVPANARLSRGLLRRTLARLGNEGRWADVQLDAMEVSGGLALLVHLSPRTLVKRVDFSGNKVFGNRDLSRLLGVREESEIEAESFTEWSQKVREAYELRGYHEAKVRIQLRDTDDPREKVLRIEIDEGQPTRIVQVVFEGEALPRRKGLRRMFGISEGDVADRERIEEGLRRTEFALREGGFYAAELSGLRIERVGRDARVVVKSKVEPRYEVWLENTGALSRGEVFAALNLHEERLAGEANLRALEQRLTDTYQRYGFRDAKVSIEAIPRVEEVEFEGERWQEHAVVLEVRIEPGEQLEVVAMRFPGAAHFEESFLQEQMYSYLEEELDGSTVRSPVDSEVADRLGFGGGHSREKRSVKKPIVRDPRRIFYESAYEEAIAHILELYHADGFLDAKVGPATLAPAEEGPGHVSVLPVAEGPRTFLYSARIENNRAFSTRELLAEAALQREAPFSYLKLEEARLRMLAAYQEKGYFYAKVEPSVRMSEDGTRAEVIFRIDEGYVVTVGSIEVRGIDRTNRSMVLNRVKLVPGEPYRPSRARKTEDALLALDIFTSISVAPDEVDLPARVKTVIISVTERKSQWLGWSAGFSTGEGVRGGFEYGYRNLFGSALTASFRGQLGYQFVFLDSEIERRYNSLTTDQRIEYQTTLTLGIPYIPYLTKTQASVDLSVLSDIQRDFRMQKQSVVGSVVYRPHRRWTFNLAQEVESSYFQLFAQKLTQALPTLPTSALVPEGENTLASTQATLAWDRRDRAYNPRKGVIISFTNEWARTIDAQPQTIGTGSDAEARIFESNMLRLMASFAFYIPLAPRLVFASQWRYGRVVHLTPDSQSYPNRRFYLGGTNFRGFNQNQMIPQDLEDRGEDASSVVSRGGETFLVAQNELRFPLIGDLYGGLFADVGNLWADPTKLDVRQLEIVVGAGLRFQTPVASLAFDYGIRAFDTQPFALRGAFQFAFQTF